LVINVRWVGVLCNVLGKIFLLHFLCRLINIYIVFLTIDLKKLIKYEKQKPVVEEKENVNVDLYERRNLLEEKQDISSKNYCKNVCCNEKKNDVFERLSRPSSKTKICSKAVSTIAVQTDLQSTKTSKI